MENQEQQTTKKCPFCAEEIRADAIKCKHCGSIINNVSTNGNISGPICKLCGAGMSKSTESKSSGIGIIVAIIGFIFLFFFPIGTIIGVFLLIYAAHLGTKRRGLWVCKKCGHTEERKMKWNEMG